MRTARFVVAATVVALAACSSSTDVGVTESTDTDTAENSVVDSVANFEPAPTDSTLTTDASPSTDAPSDSSAPSTDEVVTEPTSSTADNAPDNSTPTTDASPSTDPSSTEPPASTDPETSVDTTPSDTTPSDAAPFPPDGEEWVDHPLASLAPSPSSLGNGWTYESGDLNEAAPSDPDDVIEGCDVTPPPTLDGFDVEYTNDGATESGETDLEFTFGQGSVEEAQSLIDAFRAVSTCDLSDESFDVSYALEPIEVDGADDSVVLSTSFGDEDFGAAIGIAFARVDGIVVGGFAVSDSGATQLELAEDVVDLLNDIVTQI